MVKLENKCPFCKSKPIYENQWLCDTYVSKGEFNRSTLCYKRENDYLHNLLTKANNILSQFTPQQNLASFHEEIVKIVEEVEKLVK